jgi:hypothetical protein
MSWDGMTGHCPFCGSVLLEDSNIVPSEDAESGGYFVCTKQECVLSRSPALTLFHPIQGIKRPAGDSWALGYIK